MAYVPNSGSVAGWIQSDNASVITVGQSSIAVAIVSGSILTSSTANQSVSGTVNIGTIPGSVVAFQGTTPWVVGSVSGTVGASVIGNVNTTITSIATVGQVMGSVATLQGTLPWTISSVYGNISGSVAAFVVGSSSVITVWKDSSVLTLQPAGSIMATSATVTMTNSSVMLLNGANVIGSVTALQGTNPWIQTFSNSSIIAIATGSVVSIPQQSSIIAIATGSVVSIPQQSSILAVPVGSTISLIQGSVAAFMGGTWKPSVINLVTRNDTLASFLGANLVERPAMGDAIGRIVIKPFASEDSTIISYVGSIVSGSVQLIQASVIGSRSYITDFWLSNTGAATTLVTFQGGDTSVLGQFIAPTGGGVSSPGLSIPLKTTTSQDLAFKVSPSTSVLYAVVKGYQAP